MFDVVATVPTLLTIDEYKRRVDIISKLDGAIAGLRESGEPALAYTGEHMFSTLQKLGDSLALGLAAYARAAEGHKEAKTSGASVGYYVDDIWKALGRYAYHADDGSGVEPLCTLRYALEKLAVALAPPEPPVEAQPAEIDIAGTLSEGALDNAIGDDRDTVITEYEREQEPKPKLAKPTKAYSYPARDLLSGEGPGIAERER